ncbi:MAG: NRDE family protein [Immundisolibacter sp.]
MCLLVLAFRQLPEEPVLLAANRDEFHDRPAAPAQFWPEAPRLLAGRDLLAGGTWLGLTRDGRFAAVTNYREPPREGAPRPSRGHLVRDYLLGTASAGDYLRALQRRADRYAGFSLLLGDARQLWWYSNRGGAPQRLAPGVYGLSNALLDTPWPKLQTAKAAFGALCRTGGADTAALLDLLQDRRIHPPQGAPPTGTDAALARAAGAIFIDTPGYGTRCSSVLRLRRDDRAEFVERRHDPGGGQAEFRFSLTSKGNLP